MANYGAEEANITKRAILTQDIKSLVEDRVTLAPACTKLITTAERVYSPYVDDMTAKVYTQKCVTPLSDPVIQTDPMDIVEYVGNAITDCEESLELASWDIFREYRERLMNSIKVRLNQKVVEEIVADSTVGAAVDLSTKDLVQTFLVTVKTDHMVNSIAYRQTIDGGRVKKAPLHNQPFIAAGTAAFVKLTTGFLNVTQQSSTAGLDGQFTMTPYGVALINLGNVPGVDPNQLIYGVGGAPTTAYREDDIRVSEGRMQDVVQAGANDLEIVAGDNLLQERWYIQGKVKNKNKVFANVQEYVTAALAV